MASLRLSSEMCRFPERCQLAEKCRFAEKFKLTVWSFSARRRAPWKRPLERTRFRWWTRATVVVRNQWKSFSCKLRASRLPIFASSPFFLELASCQPHGINELYFGSWQTSGITIYKLSRANRKIKWRNYDVMTENRILHRDWEKVGELYESEERFNFQKRVQILRHNAR